MKINNRIVVQDDMAVLAKKLVEGIRVEANDITPKQAEDLVRYTVKGYSTHTHAPHDVLSVKGPRLQVKKSRSIFAVRGNSRGSRFHVRNPLGKRRGFHNLIVVGIGWPKPCEESYMFFDMPYDILLTRPDWHKDMYLPGFLNYRGGNWPCWTWENWITTAAILRRKYGPEVN